MNFSKNYQKSIFYLGEIQVCRKAIYDLSESLKIILLPDGNISDLDDTDYKSYGEAKSLNSASVFIMIKLLCQKGGFWNLNLKRPRLLPIKVTCHLKKG